MSGSVIGKLRVVLGADSAPLEKGLLRVRAQFLKVSGVASLMGAAMVAAALKGAQRIDETAKAARRLDSSIGGFEALKLAATEAGLPLSALPNEIQAMNRELASIGETGNAARSLEKLGIDAAALAGADADEKIAMIADRINELGLSSGEASSLLRDLGVGNHEMVLLMMRGGDAIRSARSDIEDYGLSISQVDASRIERANDQIARLGLVGQYAGQQIALALVPAMGRFAETITDSLREGGILRTVIDGLANNMERLGVYVGVAATAFGVRYVGALVLSKLATLTLAGALRFLKAALISSGIGIAVVAAGELAYQFTNLVKGAGGFGNAMALLGDVLREVWSRAKLNALAFAEDFKGMVASIKSVWAGAIAYLGQKWADFVGNVGPAFNALAKKAGSSLSIDVMGVQSWASALDHAAVSAAGVAEKHHAVADSLRGLADIPLGSLKALRDAMRSAKDEADETDGAVTKLSGSLDDLEKSGGSGAADKLKEVSKAASDAENAGRSFFVSMVTGAKSFRSALGELLAKLSEMWANKAFDLLKDGFSSGGGSGSGFFSFLGSLFGVGKKAYANGTPFHTGGMALVGERGPELLNLPRGSKVTPNNKLGFGGGGGAMTFNINVDGANGDQHVIGLVQQGVQAGLSAYDRKVLPGRVSSIASDPRRRG